MAGPLAGVKIVELVGIGPGPFAAMLLADMGAEVLRVHRVESVDRGYDPGGVPVLDRTVARLVWTSSTPTGSRPFCVSSPAPRRSSRASVPVSPNGSVLVPKRAWPATPGSSTGG